MIEIDLEYIGVYVCFVCFWFCLGDFVVVECVIECGFVVDLDVVEFNLFCGVILNWLEDYVVVEEVFWLVVVDKFDYVEVFYFFGFVFWE